MQGFFNFTSRRPSHLLCILELGYSVMYNDVDMVWMADPFLYLEGDHDVYFTDDMTAVRTQNLLLTFFCGPVYVVNLCHLWRMGPHMCASIYEL